MGTKLESTGPLPADPHFATTHWSAVLAAADSQSEDADSALAQLCRTYWYPLYVYVRRLGHGTEDSQDLTQEFFARLLEKRYLKTVDREKGTFRSFLLVALKRFLSNEWDKANRQKRGGGQQVVSLDAGDTEFRYRLEPTDTLTPEKAFERHWALTLLEQVLNRLESELAATGRQAIFDELKVFLPGEGTDESYPEIAGRLQMAEGTLRVTIHRLRQRYRELLRAEIAQTVADPSQIDEELQVLFVAFGG